MAAEVADRIFPLRPEYDTSRHAGDTMILKCPSCSARYLVANTSIGPTGRRVRCSSCGHVWFEEPPTTRSAPHVIAPEPPPPPRQERPSVFDDEPRSPPNINLPAMREPRRSGRGLVIGWLLLVAVVGGLGVGAYVAREDIVRFWSPAVRLYAMVGIDLSHAAAEAFPADLGLEIVHSEYAEENGELVLLIRGEISNQGTQPVEAPPLEAFLTDESGLPLESWVFDVAATTIEPGSTIGFETRRVDPSEEAITLEVRPTTRDMMEADAPPAPPDLSQGAQAPDHDDPPHAAHPEQPPDVDDAPRSLGLDFEGEAGAPSESAQ